jgi:hypothetical protein
MPDHQHLHQHYSDCGDSAHEFAAQPCSSISFLTPSSTPAQCLKIKSIQIAYILELVNKQEKVQHEIENQHIAYRNSTARNSEIY